MTSLSPQHRFAAVDERRARLFLCKATPRGVWRVEELEALRSRWENSHERGRPAILAAGPATMPPHEVDYGREEIEEIRHFAREVAQWLSRPEHAEDSRPLLVFAAPKFLGILRQCLHNKNTHLQLVQGELAHLNPSELATHPQIISHFPLNPTR